jgi:hypothetical protein
MGTASVFPFKSLKIVSLARRLCWVVRQFYWSYQLLDPTPRKVRYACIRFGAARAVLSKLCLLCVAAPDNLSLSRLTNYCQHQQNKSTHACVRTYRVSGLEVYKNTCLCFSTWKLYDIYVFNGVQRNSKIFLCPSVHINMGTCYNRYLNDIQALATCLSAFLYTSSPNTQYIHSPKYLHLNTSIHTDQRRGIWLLAMRSRVGFPVLPWELSLAGKDPHSDHGLGSL